MLSLEGVQKLIAAAVTKAKVDSHRPIRISVCDGSGFLAAFPRMEGAPLRSKRSGLERRPVHYRVTGRAGKRSTVVVNRDSPESNLR